MKKNSSIFIMVVIILILGWLLLGSRYAGHNGYYFFWRDFEKVNMVAADYDNDGNTTRLELDVFRERWLESRKLRTFQSDHYQLYSWEGRKISSREAAKLAGLTKD